MITDAVVAILGALVSPVLSLLPAGHLSLPASTGVGDSLAGLDSFIPVLGVLRLGAVMLAGLAVFLIFRVVVFLRYLLLP